MTCYVDQKESPSFPKEISDSERPATSGQNSDVMNQRQLYICPWLTSECEGRVTQTRSQHEEILHLSYSFVYSHPWSSESNFVLSSLCIQLTMYVLTIGEDFLWDIKVGALSSLTIFSLALTPRIKISFPFCFHAYFTCPLVSNYVPTYLRSFLLNTLINLDSTVVNISH